jgi:hypothetical protein
MKRDGQGKRPTRSEPTDLTGPAAAWSASQADCDTTTNLQFGGFSDWHPDFGNALRKLTETHR